jgi:hypothetical protein
LFESFLNSNAKFIKENTKGKEKNLIKREKGRGETLQPRPESGPQPILVTLTGILPSPSSRW